MCVCVNKLTHISMKMYRDKKKQKKKTHTHTQGLQRMILSIKIFANAKRIGF